MYLVLCFESFLFGLLYENSEYFRKFVNSLLFGRSDEPFAVDYFYWFWGNTWKQASKKAGSVITGAIVLESKRQQENKEKNLYADKQTNEAGEKTIKGFEYPYEREAFHKARREEWVQENGLVTKSLKFLEDLWKSSG
jgi:hypothetical protein